MGWAEGTTGKPMGPGGFRRGGAGMGGEGAEDFFDGEEPAEVDELEQAELEVEALFLPVAELIEGAEHGLEKRVSSSSVKRAAVRVARRCSSGEIWRSSWCCRTPA